MGHKKTIELSGQVSIFDMLGLAGTIEEQYSSDEISAAIEKLREAEQLARAREDAERQRKQREEQEQTERERQEEQERIEKERLEEQARREQEEREQEEAPLQETTSVELSLDWDGLNIFGSDDSAQGVYADGISDGLILSLTTLGRVDIEYISSVTGADCKTVIGTLKGSIYQNPDTWDECFYKGWETSDEYLSGNLKRKWAAAKAANEKYQGRFNDNLIAIEQVLPPTVAAKDIYVTLGSPWVPPDVIDDFILHLFGQPRDPLDYFWHPDQYKTLHDEFTGTWEIPKKTRYGRGIKVTQSYGITRMNALHILEKTLNMKTVAVTDEISCPTNTSGKKRVINQEETLAALDKQQKLITAFQKWIWRDEERKKRLETIFEDRFGCIRRRVFDGAFLTFPTLSPSVQLYPYQKDAVARIIFSSNTLLAHDVGSGKTYEMIAAGQELRRMGLSQKNMYVVPNNIVGQWSDIFSTMYPQARLLCVEPKGFAPKKRDAVLERMRDEEFDGIIIAYSCFEKIPLSREYRLEILRSRKKAVSELILQSGKATAALKKKQEALNQELFDLTMAPDDTDGMICFDQLGVTRLFVDEAHNFKNVPLDTKVNMVLGIRSAGSKKCQDMMDKVLLVQKQNDGKGVVFATGTPITNSITDAYIMQRYLQSGELAMLELQSFDSWIGMFAERTTEFEIDVDTSSYRLATRFAKFHNLPELTSLLSSIADFHQVDALAGIPQMDGYQDAVVPKTPGFAAYLGEISRRADLVRRGQVSRKDDNMLKITTDGRKAALELRLVDPSAAFTRQSKVAQCAENVAGIYRKTHQSRSAQLIFCDISTPKGDFNIYDELKDRLIRLGVPKGQIAFIHDAATEAKRSELFAKVRAGEIRVLVGSTFKLGLGVNIQDRLIALHHIDVPWRPADMTQREGRILRQGNQNSKVWIYRYITEGSFDAYSWQLLETKQRFITGLLSGSMTERSGADIEDTVLNYAEVKALAIGNPLVKERVEAANELTRYMTLQRRLVESRLRMEKELLELPAKAQNQRDAIHRCLLDLDFCRSQETDSAPQDDQHIQDEAAKRRQLRELIGNGLKDHLLEATESRLLSYRGFDIILPANMTEKAPYLWLSRAGRYRVELGDTEVGNLIRVDHVLDNLEEHLKKLRLGLSQLEKREAELRTELAKEENYSDKIKKYQKKVESLDKQLGVNQK